MKKTFKIEVDNVTIDVIVIVSIGPTVNKTGVSSGSIFPGGLSILKFSSLIDVFMLNILVQNRSAVNAGIAETYGRIQLDAYYKN